MAEHGPRPCQHQGDYDQIYDHRDHHSAHVRPQPPEGTAAEGKDDQLDWREPVVERRETGKGPHIENVAGQEREQADAEGTVPRDGQADVADEAKDEAGQDPVARRKVRALGRGAQRKLGDESALLRGKRAACPWVRPSPEASHRPSTCGRLDRETGDPLLDGLMIEAASRRLREEGARLLAARLVASPVKEGR